MGIILNLQLAVFCNHRIEPTPTNISVLMEKINALNIKEFLPNVTTSQIVDLTDRNIKVFPNISFITMDESARIICQDDRIDCIFNFNEDNQSNLEEDIQNLKEILKQILQQNKIICNRLAFNINLLSRTYIKELQSTSFGHNITSPLNFYRGKNLNEWFLRENVRCPIKILKNDELINIITELSLITSNQKFKNRLLCHMDINTIPENIGYRFHYESLDDFVNEANKFITEIRNDFKELSDTSEIY